MKAYDNDHKNSQQVGEVEEVEVRLAHFRQGRDGDGAHDKGGEGATEDQRGAPNADTWGVARPDLCVKVGWIENGNDHSKLSRKTVEGRYPWDIQASMNDD